MHAMKLKVSSLPKLLELISLPRANAHQACVCTPAASPHSELGSQAISDSHSSLHEATLLQWSNPIGSY